MLLHFIAEMRCNAVLISNTKHRIADQSLNASSHMTNASAQMSRITFGSSQSSYSGWIAAVNDEEQWIEVNLEKLAVVVGVVTKGHLVDEQGVTSYMIGMCKLAYASVFSIS